MNSNLKEILYLILVFVFCSAFSISGKYDIDNAILTEQYLTNHRQNIAIVHNILNLEDEQIFKTDEMMSKYDSKYNDLTKQIYTETKKLEILKKNKLPLKEISAQKHILKKLYSELNSTVKKETSEFMSVLNRRQRAKYRLIQHLERHNYKQERHQPKYLQKPYNF